MEEVRSFEIAFQFVEKYSAPSDHCIRRRIKDELKFRHGTIKYKDSKYWKVD